MNWQISKNKKSESISDITFINIFQIDAYGYN